MIRRTLTVLGFSVLASACNKEPELPGVARAKIAQVPGNVYCIQITVTDPGHAVQRSFDVMPFAPATLELGGLPVGVETFSGAAFPAPCSVGGVAATWIADPVTAYVSAGSVAPVSLHMRQAGSASVDVDFEDGGTPPPFDGGGDPVDLGWGGPVDLAWGGPPNDLGTGPGTPDLAQ